MLKAMRESGIGAMVFAGAWSGHTLGLEIMAIGRSAEDNDKGEDLVLEMTGRFLAYRITLRGGWVWLYAAEMDAPENFELLINVGDGEAGWRKTICPLIKSLERSGCRSLQRPIEIGESGPDSWCIA
jgi:hypothetical protein